MWIFDINWYAWVLTSKKKKMISLSHTVSKNQFHYIKVLDEKGKANNIGEYLYGSRIEEDFLKHTNYKGKVKFYHIIQKI